MKALNFCVILLILLLAPTKLVASGQVGIYAIIEKAVHEPNDRTSERRPESMTPSVPDPYLTNFGLKKLSSTGNLSAVIDKLKAALKR